VRYLSAFCRAVKGSVSARRISSAASLVKSSTKTTLVRQWLTHVNGRCADCGLRTLYIDRWITPSPKRPVFMAEKGCPVRLDWPANTGVTPTEGPPRRAPFGTVAAKRAALTHSFLHAPVISECFAEAAHGCAAVRVRRHVRRPMAREPQGENGRAQQAKATVSDKTAGAGRHRANPLPPGAHLTLTSQGFGKGLPPKPPPGYFSGGRLGCRYSSVIST
jgi:hypothetical protein